jgi:predicted nuclease of predicted toxin-antitoxin system
VKFLVDVCAGGQLTRALRGDGHDVVDLQEEGRSTDDDEVVLARGFADRRIIVTIDTDFGELIYLGGQAHAGLVRLPDWPAAARIALLRRILRDHGAELEHGAVVTVTGGRIRVSLPSDL